MSDRSIRRAAERKARKTAAKQQKAEQAVAATQPQVQPQVQPELLSSAQPQVMSAAAGSSATVTSTIGFTVDTTCESEPERRPISDAQLAANRANAQKSSGPVSETGRAKSSLNAVKTALTGQTVLLPTDDAQAYQDHLDRHFKRYAPATDEEQELVQMIADSAWRIHRIPGLEASIYAVGRIKLADLHPEQTDPAVRESVIKGEIQITYRRDLSNLALQERRLRNQHKSDLEKLNALQKDRKANTPGSGTQSRMMRAIDLMRHSKRYFGTFDPAANGFEFSLSDIEFCDEALKGNTYGGNTLPRFADILANLHHMQQMEEMAA